MAHIHKPLLGLLLFATTAFGQDAGSSDQETIRLLVQQVKELQQQVAALQAKSSGTPASAAPLSQPAEPQPDAAARAAELAEASLIMHEVHGIQWRGFGEVDYKVLDQRNQPGLGTFGFVPGSAGNFFTGDFDLFLSSKINDKASVLSEIVIGEGDAQTFNVDLERLLLKYEYDDHLKLSFGRYHTAIGYYNTAFHSGRWLQTTVNRPLIMEFAAEGGILPTQAVGVQAEGLIPSGKLGLQYILEYGSSDTVRPDIDGSGEIDDENNGNHINLGFYFRPDPVPGLQVGGSIYHDKISDIDFGPTARMSQSIGNAHVVYVAHGVEFLNEGFLIRHALEHSNLVFNNPAFYSQFSKRFGRIRPFFRYQYINANQKGSFEDVGLYYGPSFGARYDFDDNIAFKTQLDHTARKTRPDLNGLQMQLAFTF